MLGAIAGSAIGALGDIGGQFVQNEFNKGRMKDQYQYNREMYQNRYQWTMRDMRAAGLNPILAGNLGAGSPTGVGLPGSGMSTPGSTAVRAFQARQQQKLIKQQIDESKARTKEHDANAEKLRQQGVQEFLRVGTAAYEVHTAKAKMQQEQALASAYSRFGPSGLARILEMFPTMGKNIWDMIPEKNYGPRRSIYPSDVRPRTVRPHATPKKSPSKARDRNPSEPWKRRTR